jgi:transcriptional regulator with XRE-family HTH domain
MLVGLGTSSAHALTEEQIHRALPPADQTTAGAAPLFFVAVTGADPAPAEPAGAAIAELRRVSGLTWDQLARLFGVSRRSVHFWASGKPMAPSNEEHLHRVLAVLRKIDRGSASANRTALLGVRKDGSIPFDLLVARDYGGVLVLLGRGETRRVSPPKLSDQARATRAPRPPEEMVGALQDRIHPTSGRLFGAKPIATTRRK